MPSSPTPLLNIEQQAAGENLNTWGDPNLNDALQRLTEAIAATTSVSTYPVTLTSTNYVANQARSMILACGGLGGTVTIPGQSKLYIISNRSTGNVVVTAGGVSATVASGDTVPVICDGTDCRIASRTDFQNSVLKNIANGSNPLDGVNKQQIDAVLAAAQAYTDATAFASASLPGQAGNAGKFLATDGSNTAWAAVLPSFSSTLDYTLTSDGSAAVWSSPATMRTKLSLGGSALLNVGTASGTVAAGNDSRLVGAAQLSGAVFTGAIAGPSGVFTTLSGALTGSMVGNASTATALATARDLSLTGDATATLSGFNGSANVSAAVTLSPSAVRLVALPPGAIIQFGSPVVPTGYLVCNGAAVSRATYAALFATVGTFWGAGDGSTTFNVPDMRGEFVRGWDDGRGVDPARAFASAQSGAIEAHLHSVTPPSVASDGGSGFTVAGATGSEPVTPYDTASTGGTETRPRNVAVLYCIKT